MRMATFCCQTTCCLAARPSTAPGKLMHRLAVVYSWLLLSDT
jgi:hypothetical protein